MNVNAFFTLFSLYGLEISPGYIYNCAGFSFGRRRRPFAVCRFGDLPASRIFCPGTGKYSSRSAPAEPLYGKEVFMLGKIVRIHVTYPINSYNKRFRFRYKLNYGIIEGSSMQNGHPQSAYVMGINHPVRTFEGRVIALVRRGGSRGIAWVVAPKSTRFINHDIRRALEFAEGGAPYQLDCLYEFSCGAVVFNDSRKFFLIRNRRSTSWGFPKGHIEENETTRQTALREVLEETGLSIDIVPDFREYSKYTIGGRIEKTVEIFLAKAKSSDFVLQEEEVEEGDWYDYRSAMALLNYDNDKRILERAYVYLKGASADG